MDGKKQLGSPSSSSSSFTSDLFGSKDSSASSSSGIFGSIFPPPSRVLGRESLRPEATEKQQNSASQVWSTKPESQDAIARSKEGENQSGPSRDTGPCYQEQRVQQPCHLSSSLYYGGQDIYSHPQNPQGSGYSTTQLNKDGGEDDSDSASRGNWWQGSLYY
ncbi:uncharacterized protein LOC127789227 isoform X2 [Diospyros lotus]|uniref:uncharacterized protein LOC127789227 isoform X2 n=1 Tax=Diospyros lotus TaxID=55363 RepID=UPI002256DC96|nr:uncharacterized protein LOC127789227 isoform X2 [Diospyros lotus]